MGLFGNIINSVGENIANTKEQKAQDKAFVHNHAGSKAICAYFVQLFEKGQPGYETLKKNRKDPLYPVVRENSVSLCYMQAGAGTSFASMKSKDIEVASYSFSAMYQWYGLRANEGYSQLSTKTQCKTLEEMITNEVCKLPHIKFNGGFMVKMFG